MMTCMRSDHVAQAQFSQGEHVKRVNDGAPGVVKENGPWGNVWVTWAQSGLTTVINGGQIERA